MTVGMQPLAQRISTKLVSKGQEGSVRKIQLLSQLYIHLEKSVFHVVCILEENYYLSAVLPSYPFSNILDICGLFIKCINKDLKLNNYTLRICSSMFGIH